MRCLVLGAGGFLGLNLVDALATGGHAPRCGSRRTAPRLALRRRSVEIVRADLDDPASLVEAMTGADVVFHAAGHYPALSVDRQATIAMGLRQTQTVLDAAADAGVARLIYVSTMATIGPGQAGLSTEEDRYRTWPGHGVYHDAKWAMEELVLEESRLEVAVACPGACIGPWDMRVGTSALLVAIARRLNPPLPIGIVNLVDPRDVATALVRLAKLDRPPRRVLLAEGNRRMRDLARRLAHRYAAPLPRFIGADDARALADAQEERCAEKGGRPALSREIVDLVVNGVEVDNTLSREALGLEYRGLEETLNDFDAWARKRRILPTLVPELL